MDDFQFIVFGFSGVTYEEQLYLFGQIQTSQKGGQLYSDVSSFGGCSLLTWLLHDSNCKTTKRLSLLNYHTHIICTTYLVPQKSIFYKSHLTMYYAIFS